MGGGSSMDMHAVNVTQKLCSWHIYHGTLISLIIVTQTLENDWLLKNKTRKDNFLQDV